MKLGMQVGLDPGHVVLHGDPVPRPEKGGVAPNFRPMSLVAKWLHGLRAQLNAAILCYRWGPSSHPQKGRKPQISAHVYCDQTARCIKMPLGMEICLGPGNFVLDGDPATFLKKGAEPPYFQPMSIVAKRLHGSRYHLVRR